MSIVFYFVRTIAAVCLLLAFGFVWQIRGFAATQPLDALIAAAISAGLFCLALVLEFVARKSKQIRSRKRRHDDVRKPVLFLRPFEDDTALQRWQPLDVSKGIGGLFASELFGSFEGLIVDEFERFGPVVSVGDPRRRIHQLGSEKAMPGNGWKDWVTHHIQESQIILIIPGTSDGIQFEIEAALGRDAFTKSIFVFPPTASRFGKRWATFFRVIASSAKEWIDVSTLPQEPPKGLFGARFSSDGKCHLLCEVPGANHSLSRYEVLLHHVITKWRDLLRKDARPRFKEDDTRDEKIRRGFEERRKEEALDFLKAVDARLEIPEKNCDADDSAR